MPVKWKDLAGITRTLQLDGDKMHLGQSQDVEPIIEEMKKRQNGNVHEFQPNMVGKFLGRLPNTVIYEALKKYGIAAGEWMRWPTSEQAKFYKRILNDPDYRHFRAS